MQVRERRIEFEQLQGDGDRADFVRMLQSCFAVPAALTDVWLESLGAANLRILRANGTAVGGLAYYPMGQWFGGRSVPTHGIAAVGIHPEFRGRGLALELMQQSLRELSAGGAALATLYPATYTLYRRAGFELAGARFAFNAPCTAFAGFRRELDMRPYAPADYQALHELHTSAARTLSGRIDRSSTMWGRVRVFRGEPRDGYVVFDPARPEELRGYIFLLRKPGPSFRHELALGDWLGADEAVVRTLFAFVAEHRSMANDVSWHGGLTDTIAHLLPEAGVRCSLFESWMVRIVDVVRALEARGYAANLAAVLHLEVADDLLPANHGRFVVRVSDGCARVERGGEGRVHLDVRGLATLYTGFRPAEALAVAGLARGSRSELALASSLFAGPHPEMSDMF